VSRRVVANIALTLDGRITGPAGNHDMLWVVPHAFSDVVRDHLAAVHGSATTALLGSVNAEGFAAVWPAVADDPQADERDRGFARWLTATEKVVLTSSGTSSWPDARVLNEDAVSVVDKLQGEPGGDILILASVSIIMRLLDADRLDRLSVVLVPEILGGGRPFFADQAPPASSWTLTSSTASDSGALALIYDRGPRSPR
jgi:dihydrofolate reductase